MQAQERNRGKGGSTRSHAPFEKANGIEETSEGEKVEREAE